MKICREEKKSELEKDEQLQNQLRARLLKAHIQHKDGEGEILQLKVHSND